MTCLATDRAKETCAGDAQNTGGYPPIGDYAVIGDCRTAALISRDGALDWLCLPRFSSPAVFAALLDRRRGGYFAVRPQGPCDVERRYVGETNVLETTFSTPGGRARLTDLMPAAPGTRGLHPESEVLRIVEGLDGETTFEITFAPRPDYGRAAVRLERRGRCLWACAHAGRLLLLHTDAPLQRDAAGDTLRGRVRVAAGERIYLALAHADRRTAVIPALGEDADQRLQRTLRWWQGWSGRCRYQGPYRDQVVRAALALKLLTYAPSGAVLAAATTSLPERIGGTDNYDYRFCWLRDAALTLHAFAGLGHADEASAFMRWLLNATRLSDPRLQVLYDVFGETRVPETELRHFQGYRGARPVRIGNAASDQFQLDVYGEVVLAAAEYVRRGGRLTRYEARLLVNLGKTVCQLWREPDNGIWEFRTQRRHYVHSKFMAWLALDRLLQLAADEVVHVPRARFQRERDAIREAIERDGFDAERGTYRAAFGAEDLDASLLLMGVYGYGSARDPRLLGTCERIDAVLGRRGLVRRYGHVEAGPAEGEAAFGICSFWMVEHLARAGRREEATARFEGLLKFANDVGLYAEEIDPDTGMALGNFPQAFTMVGLISAALALGGERIEEAQRGRPA